MQQKNNKKLEKAKCQVVSEIRKHGIQYIKSEKGLSGHSKNRTKGKTKCSINLQILLFIR